MLGHAPRQLGLCRKAGVRPVSQASGALSLFPGHSLHASLVRNLQGTGTPPEATGLGLAAQWSAFTKPGPGFLRNPGLMPVPEAAGTKTRDGIKDRLWAQLLFLEARPHGVTAAASYVWGTSK